MTTDDMKFRVLEEMIQGLDNRVYKLEEQVNGVGLTLQEILGILVGQEIAKVVTREHKKKEEDKDET